MKSREMSNFKIDVEKVKKLYLETDENCNSIGRLLGYDPEGVRRCLKRNGIQVIRKPYDRRNRKGEEHPGWKGGRTIHQSGYVMIRSEHPRTHKKGYAFEHILVWEETHNKPLPKGWVIHHLNGVKSDNRPENLVAMPRGEHTHQAEPFKQKIRELEAKVKLLERTLESNQLIFNVGDS